MMKEKTMCEEWMIGEEERKEVKRTGEHNNDDDEEADAAEYISFGFFSLFTILLSSG
jgi:hypothetical protein